jgi:hypothetical protein
VDGREHDPTGFRERTGNVRDCRVYANDQIKSSHDGRGIGEVLDVAAQRNEWLTYGWMTGVILSLFPSAG